MLIIRPYSLPEGEFFILRFYQNFANQNRPVIFPCTSTSMSMAAGIVMMLPQTTTTKPAPALKRTSRTFSV